MTISNWNGSVRFAPAVVETPSGTNRDELKRRLVEIVTDRTRWPSPLRAVGELHSLNEAAATEGTVVFMRNFDWIDVAPDRQTVTVGAGVRMIDLKERLKPLGRQLEVTPEIGNATAGSVACCGTKDSSLRDGPGQISSCVKSVRVIRADGRDDEISQPDELAVLRSSYGLVGIIYEVTFHVVKRVKVKYRYKRIRLDDDWLAKGTTALLGDADGFLGFMLPYRRRIIVERRYEVKNAWRVPVWDGLKAWARTFAWTTGARPFMGLLRPLPRRWQHFISKAWSEYLEGRGFDLFFLWFIGGFASWRADAMIDFKRPVSSYFEFTFWAFPAGEWPRIVPDFFEFCDAFRRRTGFRPRLPVEVYFIRQDARAALSFCRDGDIFTLDLVNWTDEEPALWKQMNVEFNEFAALHGGRPLLNQTKHLSPQVTQQLWGRMDGFQRIAKARELADRGRRFLTPFFEQRLP